MKRITTFLFTVAIACISTFPAAGQEIVTAGAFFDRVSDRYRDIVDYQAHVVITQEDNVMLGTLYHKRPNLLRIDFDQPADQTIAVDGENLVIYIPYLSVRLKQKLRERDEPAAGLATSQGLELMRSKYSIAYLDSPNPVPLDEDGSEMVVKLKLEWRSVDEGFRQITLAVSENLLIRRLTGVTAGFEQMQIDFTNVLLNQNLSDGRFRYDEPSTANVINDFIFDSE